MEKQGVQKMLKASAPSKATVVRINLIFLSFSLIVYAFLFLRPSSSTVRNAPSLVRCSLHDCHHKAEIGVVQMKAVLEETPAFHPRNMSKMEKPEFLSEVIGREHKIGMVNMEGDDVSEWREHGEIVPVMFEKVSEYMEWSHLFPEWIDEEEESDGPSCPELPMPDLGRCGRLDVVVVKLPCKYPEEGWARDVHRLQVHLVAANTAAKKGTRDQKRRTKVVLWSKCTPMLELFRCEDLVRREGDWWYYESEAERLEHKVSLPVGSCQLALPLWAQGINEEYDITKLRHSSVKTAKREAYATVLHSSESYVCGAITLAQSLLQTGTKRDLILLLDKSISAPKLAALAAAGWQIRVITRIRNPRAEKRSYNEYNYSKFRLWQLTDYDKVVFIDADIIVLRNLDLLFHFPQMSAAGNDGSIFNSGVMVIEPSNCTFQTLMARRDDIISYNGGDQGFLNEVYVWWHRLPRRMNFLKNFWANTSAEANVKNQLFGAEPAKLYAVHYLGLKPWQCYRDYDCNWDIEDQRVYASDVAHRRWWRLHDGMAEGLRRMCALTERRRIELDWDRMKAKKKGLPDKHWRIHVTDPRRFSKNLI